MYYHFSREINRPPDSMQCTKVLYDPELIPEDLLIRARESLILRLIIACILAWSIPFLSFSENEIGFVFLSI